MIRAFGPYRPDQSATTPGVTRYVTGVQPIDDAEAGIAYAPLESFQAAIGAAALGAPARGAIGIIREDGSFNAFVGTSTDIYQVEADFGYLSIDSGLSLSSDDDWSFTHFGQFLIYGNLAEPMRQYNVETAGSPSAISGAPQARFVLGMEQTVLAFYCDDDPLCWHNCAYGNHTKWTGAEANSDSLEDGGALIAAGDIGNGYAIVAQTDAIRRFQVTGGGVKQTQIAREVGSAGARSFVPFNGVVYFLDKRGFFKTNGSAPEPIGFGKVDRTFLSLVGRENLALVRGAADPERKIVWWAYPALDFMIGYSWALNEWTYAPNTLQAFFRMATPGYTLTTAATLGTLTDLAAYPLNSSFYKGGVASLSGIDADGKIGFFNGSYMAAEIHSSLYRNEKRVFIRSVSPVTDDLDATLAVSVVDQAGEVVTEGTDVARKASGRTPQRASGKHFMFTEKHAAGGAWSYARGVDGIESRIGGPR